MKITSSKVLVAIVYLIAIAFSIKSLREPDLWWQIRTGEWIIEHCKIPTVDMFSMTNAGTEWINIKWLFEVIAALITKYLGAESVFLLQVIVSVLIVYFLRKTVQLFEIKSSVILFYCFLVLLIGVQYRMIGRPEMFSHLFQVISLYLLLRFHKSHDRFIWLLVPLQVIWTNIHEAYGMGLVMVGLFWFGNFTYAIKARQPKSFRLLKVFGVMLIATCLNPRGWTLLFRQFNIFSQLSENKYTTELDNVFAPMYWNVESYLLIVIVLISIFLLYTTFKRGKINDVINSFSFGYIVLIIAFLGLALTAYRNIVFLYLLIFPILVISIDNYVNTKTQRTKLAIALGVILYVSVVSNGFYRLIDSRDRYGLEVLSTHNPIGAANYIAQKGLKSKKGFADYLTSSYLLWSLQPYFKTYIDLRDLDVFSNSDFDSYLKMVNFPNQYIAVDDSFKFDYVVLYRLADPYLHAYLYRDSIYACTYVDAVAAVYEKTDDFTRDDIFSRCKPVLAGKMAQTINYIFNPLYEPFDYENLNQDYFAADYYFTVGRLQLASFRIRKYLLEHPDDALGLVLYEKINSVSATSVF
jgi:hypothetical protein